MDDLTERDVSPSVGTDAVSELMPLLQSEEWQRRLEAAREQRERILAERGPAPEPPARPSMPRLEVVGAAALTATALPRIEPLSGLRAGPVPRTDPLPIEDEEFEEFEDVSIPPPRPLPGLRVVPSPPVDLSALQQPPATLPPAAEPPVHFAIAPSMDTSPIPAAQKPLLTPRLIGGGFALGLAIGLGISVSSLLTSWLATSTARAPETPVAVAPAPPAVEPALDVDPPAAPAPQIELQAAVVDTPPPRAVAVPATPGPRSDDASDTAPLLPVALAGPVAARSPIAPGAVGAELPPASAPGAALTPVFAGFISSVAQTPTAEATALRLAPISALTHAAAPPLTGLLSVPDDMPLAAPRADAIQAATATLALAALAPGDTLPRRPLPGLALPRPMLPAVSSTSDPDAALSAREAPPALPPVDIQIFVPSGTSDDALADTTARLAAAGFASAKTQPIEVTIKENHVRFYHEADQQLAERLAATVNGTARSFVGGKNAPAEGVVELWLAGAPSAPAIVSKPAGTKPAKVAKAAKPKKQQTAAAKPAAPARATQTDQITAMKSRIAEKFSLEKFK